MGLDLGGEARADEAEQCKTKQNNAGLYYTWQRNFSILSRHTQDRFSSSEHKRSMRVFIVIGKYDKHQSLLTSQMKYQMWIHYERQKWMRAQVL